MKYLITSFFSIFAFSIRAGSNCFWYTVSNFVWITGYLFVTFFLFLSCLLRHVFPPGLVSIPLFGFSLCSSLYMRRFCLIPANPHHVFISSHHHPTTFNHRYRMTRFLCHMTVPSGCTVPPPHFCAKDVHAQTETPMGFCSAIARDVDGRGS